MDNESIKTTIIRIGNSQGIRIPKSLLAMTGIERDVEVSISDGYILIKPARVTRDSWAESFATMAREGDDMLLDDSLSTQWDERDWEWK